MNAKSKKLLAPALSLTLLAGAFTFDDARIAWLWSAQPGVALAILFTPLYKRLLRKMPGRKNIAALATLVIKLMAAPYWLYASVLTVTIVFTTFSPQNAVTGDILRVGITLGTALVSAVAAVIAARLFRMRASR